MPIRRLQTRIPRYGIRSNLVMAGLMVFFFVIFDGVLMYLAPVVMTGAGISDGVMGLIIGSSSVAGMLFDVVLARLLQKTHYRRMFLYMFLLAAMFPVFLFGPSTVTFYLLAMAVWGFYYNYYEIGTTDFVERTGGPDEQASNFGILSSFQGSGYFLAPFAASILLLFLNPGPRMLIAVAVPLGVAFLFYLALVLRPVPERKEYAGVSRKKSVLSLFTEMELWSDLWRVLTSILLLTLLLNLIDAALWTFGPLFSQQLGVLHGFSGGVFMTAYALPPILVGWVVGRIARRFGDERTALWSVALGSLILIPVGMVSSPVLLIGLIFAVSVFFSIGWPSVGAVFTTYIERVPIRRKETETVEDLFTNIGDTAGPIVGGYMAQYLGFAHSFVAIGSLGVIATILLIVLRSSRSASVPVV